MNVSTPQYILFLESSRTLDSGRWRFSLQTPDGSEHLAADDVEPDTRGERLDLLTVVRALEALDQPSQVTLVGCSRYVRNGLQYGLPEWRSNGWRWEFFGQMMPVKNGDLWQRLDRALRFHQVECRPGATVEFRPDRKVECRQRRFDPPQATLAGRHQVQSQPTQQRTVSAGGHPWIKYAQSTLPAARLRRVVGTTRRCGRLVPQGEAC